MCWKPKCDGTKYCERYFRADAMARRTESLSKLNNVDSILFGMPVLILVRNMPKHVRTLRVLDSRRCPWTSKQRLSKFLLDMPVRVKMSESDKDLSLSKSIRSSFPFIAISRVSLIRLIRSEWLNMDVHLDWEIFSVALVLKTLSDKCPGQHLAPTGNIRSLSKKQIMSGICWHNDEFRASTFAHSTLGMATSHWWYG